MIVGGNGIAEGEVQELVMVTEEPMELASKRARGELSHWPWVVPNVFGSEIQQGKPQTILGGWVMFAAGHDEGGGYVVYGVHGLGSGGSSGGIDVGPRLGFES